MLILAKLLMALITFAQSSGVTCLATREWVDLISGKSDMAVVCKVSNLVFWVKNVVLRGFLQKKPDWVWRE